jgi:hypothetical protein
VQVQDGATAAEQIRMDAGSPQTNSARVMDMPVLDVGLGVSLMYLLLSLIVTTLQEAMASLFKWRAQNLYAAVASLLADPKLSGDWQSLATDLYQHPLVSKLCRKHPQPASPAEFGAANRFRLPSYLSSRTFAVVLFDVLRQKSGVMEASGASHLLANAREIVERLPEGMLKQALVLHVSDAEQLGTTVDERARIVSERIESWFNDAMQRASGWYKRRAQLWSVGLGFLVAALSNASTFHVVKGLWSDSSLRAAVAASAQAFHEQGTPVATGALAEQLKAQIATLQASNLPIGWTMKGWQAFQVTSASTWLVICGWIVTAFAVSLGAAFWFDILGKALQIRGSGGKISATTGKAEGK